MGTPEDVAAEEYFTPPEGRVDCPFCGEKGFDRVGLKYHLQHYCLHYANLEKPPYLFGIMK